MNIEKLPSGSYRIRKQYKGKRYDITLPYKPTQKEVIQLLSDKLDNAMSNNENARKTLLNAIDEYLSARSRIISPSTMREYLRIPDRLSEGFKSMLVEDITAHDIQKETNRLAEGRSQKTLKNYVSFVISAIRAQRPDFNPNILFPQKVTKEVYIPSQEDVRIIVEASKGTSYEIPIMLGCMGMRKSEICALTLDDVEGNTITINKSLVENSKNEWVIKPHAKTEKSNRKIVVSDEIIEKIKEQGYVYKGFPNQISKFMNRVQDKNDIPHFSLHKLRHYFASRCSEMRIPDADIMKMGGWSTDHVLKSVYRHSLDKENKMQELIAKQMASDLF